MGVAVEAMVYKGFRRLGRMKWGEVERLIEELPPTPEPDPEGLLAIEFPDGSRVLVSRDSYPDHAELHFSIKGSDWGKTWAHEFVKLYLSGRAKGRAKRWVSDYLGKGFLFHIGLWEEGERKTGGRREEENRNGRAETLRPRET